MTDYVPTSLRAGRGRAGEERFWRREQRPLIWSSKLTDEIWQAISPAHFSCLILGLLVTLDTTHVQKKKKRIWTRFLEKTLEEWTKRVNHSANLKKLVSRKNMITTFKK